MTTIPDFGTFVPNSRNNAAAGVALEAAMSYLRETWGGNYQGVTISAGAITAITSNLYVDTEGGAANDDLDRINSPGRPVGAIIKISCQDGARDVHVRGSQGGTGQIFLSTTPGHTNVFSLWDPSMSLWLQRDGSGNWAEIARHYGAMDWAHRDHLGLGQGATMQVASTGEMQSLSADNRIVTPAKITTTLNTFERVIEDRPTETARWLNSWLLIGRSAADAGGTSWLRKIKLEDLLGAAFRSYQESGEIALTGSGSGSINMGFGSTPRMVYGFLRNKIAEHGYNPGDEVRLDGAEFGGTTRIISLTAYNSGVAYAISSDTAQMPLIDFGTKARFLTNTNNWRLVIRGWR